MDISNLPELIRTLFLASVGLLVLFVILQFILSIISLWLSSKIVKSINDEFISALKVVGIWFLFSIILSGLEYLLYFFPESLASLVNILSTLFGLGFIVISFLVAKKIYDLKVGETIKMFFFTGLIQFVFVLILAVLFGGTIFGVVKHKIESFNLDQSSDLVVEEQIPSDYRNDPNVKIAGGITYRFTDTEFKILDSKINYENLTTEEVYKNASEEYCELLSPEEYIDSLPYFTGSDLGIKMANVALLPRKHQFFCYFSLAIKSQDVSLCKKANDLQACPAMIATIKNDTSICGEKIQKDDGFYEMDYNIKICIENYAKYSGDYSVCYFNSNEAAVENCLIDVARYSLGRMSGTYCDVDGWYNRFDKEDCLYHFDSSLVPKSCIAMNYDDTEEMLDACNKNNEIDKAKCANGLHYKECSIALAIKNDNLDFCGEKKGINRVECIKAVAFNNFNYNICSLITKEESFGEKSISGCIKEVFFANLILKNKINQTEEVKKTRMRRVPVENKEDTDILDDVVVE